MSPYSSALQSVIRCLLSVLWCSNNHHHNMRGCNSLGRRCEHTAMQQQCLRHLRGCNSLDRRLRTYCGAAIIGSPRFHVLSPTSAAQLRQPNLPVRPRCKHSSHLWTPAAKTKGRSHRWLVLLLDELEPKWGFGQVRFSADYSLVIMQHANARNAYARKPNCPPPNTCIQVGRVINLRIVNHPLRGISNS